MIFFTLAPVLPGIFLSLYLAAMGIFSSAENTAVTDGVFGTLGLVIASAILGLILYGVPALILSIIYACFELHRCFKHIAITGLAGGLTALMWSHLVPLDMKPAVIFASGAVSSLLTAIYALPKESR
ncbi:hypothetical protein GAO09_15940 [Rhizobiales bacterium RZME27]|uniref:Uncharacterized protein n=1 Tax=Endobacterium cereale TaxID=2663029 RepID=A0A6A8AE86_9HYPH|nr:hypothetical protein [Endobacterium cereale]MEB2847057.1 hypothetical protein [Endobacterium cereale]MQY47526.1 hypothetical protein [Endobacterium cereale]